MKPATLESAKIRFLQKIEKGVTPNDCWPWIGSKFQNGYGQFSFENRTLKAHRFAYFIATGDAAYGLCVLHKCDNPACVNPNHLIVGTNKDNSKDMVSKNRQCRGEKHPFRIAPELSSHGVDHYKAKLTDEKVIEMRKLHASGIGTPRLGKMFGVAQSQAMRIVSRKSWRHVA